jgi:uncharacterized protein
VADTTEDRLRASRSNGGSLPLSNRESDAGRALVERVIREVPARLEHVLLFGSRARGTHRPDSDVDLLLVFRSLPPDREPQATIVERIAEELSDETGVPIGPWSVARIDLRRGNRTPMLVDALTDGIAIWPPDRPPPRPRFTPDDALRCAAALLQRVDEGSDEAARRMRAGDHAGAVRRARDDVVRMCTAALLLHGETRPRRAEAVVRFVERYRQEPGFPRRFLPQLEWAAGSFGPGGDDEERAPAMPPGGYGEVAALVDRLAADVAAGRAALARWSSVGANIRRHGEYENGGPPARGAVPSRTPENRGP